MSQEESARLTIVLYSDDVTVRAQIWRLIRSSNLQPALRFASMLMARREAGITALISLFLMEKQPLKAAWE